MEFQETKELFKDVFMDLRNLLEKLIHIVNEFDKQNAKLNEFLENNSNEDFPGICDHIKINLNMIERNYMKCVIFGKTSNGKSAILNALMKKDIFPSFKGRTTCCFIRLEGCDDENGYIIDKKNHKHNINDMESLACEYSKTSEKCGIKDLLKAFYPRSKCEILKHDVVIFDTPGVDFSKENDELIREYCEDADVFLLAVDGCSTLSESERSFFRTLNRLICIPSILVLINKWDLVTSDDEMDPERVKDQHHEEIKTFLKGDLKLYNDVETLRRIFFISARESLRNSNVEDQSSSNNSFVLEEFQRFEDALNDDLCSNAIKIKFKRHYEKGQEIGQKILTFSSRFPMFIQKVQLYDTEMREKLLRQCKDTVFSRCEELKSECSSCVSLESTHLALNIKKAIENTSTYLERSIKIMEETLSSKLGDIYERKIITLQEELRKIFINNSHILMTLAQMKRFFDENLKLTELVKNFKDCIQTDFKGAAADIKKIFQEKHDNTVTMSKIREYLRIGGPVLVTVGTAISRIHPTTGTTIACAGMFANEYNKSVLLNEPKIPMEDSIKNELFSYFYTWIEALHHQNSSKIELMVSELADRFVDEQLDMIEVSKQFEDVKKESESILSKLNEIHRRHSNYF